MAKPYNCEKLPTQVLLEGNAGRGKQETNIHNCEGIDREGSVADMRLFGNARIFGAKVTFGRQWDTASNIS